MSEVKKEKKEAKKTTKKVAEKKETQVIKKTTRTKKEKNIEEGLLNKTDQKNCRSICKIIRIISKIGKIALMIFVPFIFITMIIIPFLFKNFEISANIIKFGDVNVIANHDHFSIKVGDNTHVLKCNPQALDKITTFLTENSKNSIVTFSELTLLLFAIIIIVDIYLLSYLEKLFYNFETKETPFIKENLNYIYKIFIFMCALKFIDICINIADVSVLKVNSFSLIEILVVLACYFIFGYAVKLQDKNPTKIYD